MYSSSIHAFGSVAALRACVLLLAALSGPAFAQVFTNADVDAVASGAETLVLSNHRSASAPTSLINANPDPTTAVNLPATSAPRRQELAFGALIAAAAARTRISEDLLRAVISVESGFDAAAKSSRGAVGLMQLMPATARRFGAQDALIPEQNVHAGARYLEWLSVRFDGRLPLVLAAYNAGEGAVAQAGNRIPNIIETRAYVVRVLARLQATSRDIPTLRHP